MSWPPEIWTTPAAYAEIMEADRIERGRDEEGMSSGSLMLAAVRSFIPEKVAPELPKILRVVVKPWLPVPAIYICDERMRATMESIDEHMTKWASPEKALAFDADGKPFVDRRISLRIYPATQTHCGIAGTLAKCPRLLRRELDMRCEAYGHVFDYDEDNPDAYPERLSKCREAETK